MNSTMFTKGAIPVLEKGISFHTQRHRVITSNLANVNTPYYQARDLPVRQFYNFLNRAVDSRRAEGGNPRRFEFRPWGDVSTNAHGSPRFRTVPSGDVNQLRHDGNNVDIDMEMSKLARNTLMHNTLVGLLNNQFQMIGQAISGRVI